MKRPGQEFSLWRRGRFLGVVGILIVAQVGLIALFGARGAKPLAGRTASTQFRAVGELGQQQLRRLFFASDPTVFIQPSAYGFSGRAWMNQSPPHYQSTNQLEAPRWLALDTTRLGAGPAVEDSDSTAPFMPARMEIPQPEPLPVFLSPMIVPTQSVFHIEGEMAKRLIGPAPTLRAWPSLDRKLLANTVVRIAVDPAGDVLAARLLNQSGSPEADADAVSKVSALRFRAEAEARTNWAQAVFRWQTTFPEASATPP